MVTAAEASTMADFVLGADRVITPEETYAHGWVRIRQGWVAAVGEGSAESTAADVYLPGRTLVPGLVDVHNHGGGGFSYTDGDGESAAAAAHSHRVHGTTTTVASLVTAPLETLHYSVRALADLVDDGVLAGLHLEGPWLSPRQHGAHDPALMRTPCTEDVERLMSAGRGTIRMVTLAPELDGATAATRGIVEHGAVAALGHTDGGYEATRSAINAGATVGTHLFNAMRTTHHREPGPATALLEDPRCRVELIADGIHLHDAMLRQAAQLAGTGGFMLVTDAMAAAAAPDGQYRLGDADVTVSGGEARLATTGGIAGSTLTQHAALRHFLRATQIPLAEAVRAATQSPARALGLRDVGALTPGHRADLVALDENLEISGVMRHGHWIVEPS